MQAICRSNFHSFDINFFYLIAYLTTISWWLIGLVFQVLRVWLTNVTSHALTSIVSDPFVGAWGPRAYVGGSRSGALLVIGQSGWWQIGLDVKSLEKERMHAVGAVTLALSRRESLLYLAEPDSDRMFSLDLSAIRSSPQPSSNVSRCGPHLISTNFMAKDIPWKVEFRKNLRFIFWIQIIMVFDMQYFVL